METIRSANAKFCVYRGRARRSEFWLYYLFTRIILYVPTGSLLKSCINFIQTIIKDKNTKSIGNYWPLIILGIFLFIFFIVSIPLLSLSVRRLHDTGKSGCYLFLIFVPFGILILIALFAQDSDRKTNEYGPSPKYVRIHDASLLKNSQVISVEGTPYRKKQIAPGNNMQYPENQQSIQDQEQYPQYQQIVEQQNQENPENQEINEENIQIINNQQNQQIAEQQNQEINNQENLEPGPIQENKEDFDMGKESIDKPTSP